MRIKSNRESKHGRYDIMLIPHDKNKNGVVIEIKSIEKQQAKKNNIKFTEKVNHEIHNALVQIEKNKYYTELLVNRVNPEKINKLAIVFAVKEPYINPV
jgi:phosphopantetheinyl transferase (holo-ACP synthase)